ncbi:MAG: molybdopterin-dependent oxidoreductase [Microbacteriaceae bacterium]|nr:molybdopterin-dependent oxidoreductase [Microbacteriaceae bacterium]
MSVRIGRDTRPETGLAPRIATAWAAFAGVMAAAVVLGVAEVVSLFAAAGSPLFAVGSLVIDLAPAGVKEFVIALFGTGDKAALLTLMGILIVVISAAAGVLEMRRSPFGVIVIGIGGVVALIAVVTRAGATGFSGIATVVGAVAGVVVLRLAIERLGRWQRAAERRASAMAVWITPGSLVAGPQLERRGFLIFAIAAGAASVVAGVGARLINATTDGVAAIRTKLTLPKAAVAAEPVSAGAVIDVPGISPFVTANADFYRIDTALQVPSINPDKWRLKVTGMVENEVSLSFAELLAKPLEEHLATLTCVSNDVGGDLIGNALWLGYPIRNLLAQAVPTAGADMVLSTSIDGFTAGTPLSVLQDTGTNAMLAVGMNGTALPLEHGFPARMVVPGLYGYVSATKWVVELKVTKFSEDQGYWTPRGWDAKGPIKLASRIDTPLTGAALSAGTIAIAGVAWEQHVGVKTVEVQVDDGPWVEASLADSISPDTWRQWVYRWPARKGSHRIRVRATDAAGNTQRQTRQAPAPNGSEGWHSITVNVS